MIQGDKNSYLSDRQQREAIFFDDEAEKILAASKSEEDIRASLLVDDQKAIEEYPDYYKYAYKILGDLSEKNILDMLTQGKISSGKKRRYTS